MSTLIKNADVVTAREVLSGADVLVADGKITAVGYGLGEADEVIDAGGAWLLPGFVDLHCHGGDGYEFMDADEDGIRHIAKFHLENGTTSMLATTLAADAGETDRCLYNLGKHLASKPGGTIVGVHLEGPWFNPEECGAQNPEYIKPHKAGELTALLSKYPFIKRVSAAPEIEGGLQLGDEGSGLGLLMSVAHTAADFAEVEAAAAHGYTMMTHLYSGMRGVIRKNSFRVAGAVEAGLYLDDMYVEIIADGCHLPHELLKYIYKIKGEDRICLITDAIRAAGMPNGAVTKIGSMERGLDVVVEDEVAKLPDRQSFAGSTATTRRLFENMMAATNGDAVAVAKMASTTPARLVGLNDRGEVSVGKRADLVIMNKDYKIKNVILNGEKI